MTARVGLWIAAAAACLAVAALVFIDRTQPGANPERSKTGDVHRSGAQDPPDLPRPAMPAPVVTADAEGFQQESPEPVGTGAAAVEDAAPALDAGGDTTVAELPARYLSGTAKLPAGLQQQLRDGIEAFAGEERGTAWGAAAEQKIREQFDLQPFSVTYSASQVECRASRCLVSATIDVHVLASQQRLPEGHWNDAMEAIRTALRPAMRFSSSGVDGFHVDPDTGEMSITSFWTREREPAAEEGDG